MRIWLLYDSCMFMDEQRFSSFLKGRVPSFTGNSGALLDNLYVFMLFLKSAFFSGLHAGW